MYKRRDETSGHHRIVIMMSNMTFKCATCIKEFKSEGAVRQHFRDKHNLHVCLECDKFFNSDRSLAQHTKSVHTKTISTSAKEKKVITPSKPPFPGASGEWVLRQDFPLDKSFGRFECGACGNTWGSAHSWKMNLQNCKKCETGTPPSLMWMNDDNQSERSYDTDSTSVSRGPHDESRCGKCIELRKSGRHEKCTELRKSGRHV
jgi:hypothetical protein